MKKCASIQNFTGDLQEKIKKTRKNDTCQKNDALLTEGTIRKYQFGGLNFSSSQMLLQPTPIQIVLLGVVSLAGLPVGTGRNPAY
jgi:hypothetical protein